MSSSISSTSRGQGQRREAWRRARSKVKREMVDYCSKESWKERFPFTSWLPSYRPHMAVNDAIAGLTVGLTVLPQGLAYAGIAKLPPVFGLYAAIMGGFLYAILGMSKDISVGPTAIMSLLVSQYGTPLEGDDELHDPTYAILLAFFCGLIQMLMGVLHLGFIANYISAVVISAFTSASAVTIAMSQVKSLLGIKFPSETFIHDLIETCKHIKETRWQDLTLGLSCIVALAMLRFMKNKAQRKLEDLGKKAPLKRKLPWRVIWLLGTARNAILVVVAASITYGLHKHDKDDTFRIVGNVTAGLPPIGLPHFGAEDILKHLNVGLIVIPLLGFLENIAIAKGFARQNDYRVDTNQELIALGSCNIGSSLVSGYPITGSFSRSAINNQSGVMTQAAGIVTGIIILLSLAFLTPIFYYIPKASLAAVIIYSVIFMIDYHIVVELWRVRKIDLLPLFVTFIFSLWLGVEYGTIIGILVDLVLLLYPYGKPGFKTRDDESSIIIIHMEQGLRFPSVGTLQALLDDRALMRDMPRPAIIDFSNVSSIDYSVIEGLKDCVKSFRKKHLSLVLAGVRPKLRRMIDRAKLNGVEIYESVDDALRKMDIDLKPSHSRHPLELTSLMATDIANNHVEINGEADVEMEKDHAQDHEDSSV